MAIASAAFQRGDSRFFCHALYRRTMWKTSQLAIESEICKFTTYSMRDIKEKTKALTCVDVSNVLQREPGPWLYQPSKQAWRQSQAKGGAKEQEEKKIRRKIEKGVVGS